MNTLDKAWLDYVATCHPLVEQYQQQIGNDIIKSYAEACSMIGYSVLEGGKLDNIYHIFTLAHRKLFGLNLGVDQITLAIINEKFDNLNKVVRQKFVTVGRGSLRDIDVADLDSKHLDTIRLLHKSRYRIASWV